MRRSQRDTKWDQAQRLIEKLVQEGFEVRAAFWARLANEDGWYLYLASSFVDEQGPKAAYRRVLDVMDQLQDLWISPFEIRVIGIDDSLAVAVLAVTEPKVPNSKLSVRNPKPYPGMTRFGETTLGGISIAGAYIYPPFKATVPT